MTKVKTLDDLKKMRDRLRKDLNIREDSNHPEQLPQIMVSMGTCGIAAGAKEVMSKFVTELCDKNIHAVVTQIDCMGHCDAEPVIEIILPGKEPVVYGNVAPSRVAEIIETHIVKGKPADGVLSATGKASV